MANKSSVWDQPVAPLFSTEPALRQRRARAVLRQMRQLVASGKQRKLLDALLAVDAQLLDREFARYELTRCLLPGFQLAVIHQFGDANLVLWLIDKALERCGVAAHRGGHMVTSRPAVRREAA